MLKVNIERLQKLYGGINVVISPNSKTIINLFDIEIEKVKDEITGRERPVLNVENKIEDVTQALLTMARGSTRSEEVNELTKQIIAEVVAEEYPAVEAEAVVEEHPAVETEAVVEEQPVVETEVAAEEQPTETELTTEEVVETEEKEM